MRVNSIRILIIVLLMLVISGCKRINLENDMMEVNISGTYENENHILELESEVDTDTEVEVPYELTDTEDYYQLCEAELGIVFSYEYCDNTDKWNYTFSYEDVNLHERCIDDKWVASVEYNGKEQEVLWAFPVNGGWGGLVECQKADITNDGYEDLLVYVCGAEYNSICYIYDLKNMKDISPFYSTVSNEVEVDFVTTYIVSNYIYKEYGDYITLYRHYSSEAGTKENEEKNVGYYLESDPMRYDVELSKDNQLIFEYRLFTYGTDWKCTLVFESGENSLILKSAEVEQCYQVYTDNDYHSDNILECEMSVAEDSYCLNFCKDNVVLRAVSGKAHEQYTASIKLEYKGEEILLNDWYIGAWDEYGYFELKDMDGDISNELVLYRGYNVYSVKVTENPNPVNSADRYSYEEVCEEIEEIKVFDFDTMSILE